MPARWKFRFDSLARLKLLIRIYGVHCRDISPAPTSISNIPGGDGLATVPNRESISALFTATYLYMYREYEMPSAASTANSRLRRIFKYALMDFVIFIILARVRGPRRVPVTFKFGPVFQIS